MPEPEIVAKPADTEEARPKVDWKARVEAMSPAERKAWAVNVTDRLRDCVLVVADAHYTLEERKRVLLDTVNEAYYGGAWRLRGFLTWQAYWQDQMSDDKLWNTKDERNEMIRHLKANGFSTRNIAPIVGLNHSSIVRIINFQEPATQGGQLVHDAPVAHPQTESAGKPLFKEPAETSGPVDHTSAGDNPASGPMDHTSDGDMEGMGEYAQPPAPVADHTPVVKSLDGKTRILNRDDDALMRDWLWFMGLKYPDGAKPTDKDAQPVSNRQLETETGIPRRTIDYTLGRGERLKEKLYPPLYLKIVGLRDGEGLTVAETAERLGLRVEAVKWAQANPPYIRDLLDPDDFRAWYVSGDGGLSLVDGTTATQTDIARLLGVSQPRVSQLLKAWGDDYGLTMFVERHAQDTWKRKSGLAELPSTNIDIGTQTDYAAEDLREAYRRQPIQRVEGKERDLSPKAWADMVDHYLANTDPGKAAAYYEAISDCLADLLPRIAGWVNMIGHMPDGVGMDSYRPLFDACITLGNTLPGVLDGLGRLPGMADRRNDRHRTLLDTIQQQRTRLERLETQWTRICANDLSETPAGQRGL